MSDDYTHVVLTTGEEIIGRLIGETEDGIHVDDALTLYYTPPNDESPGISLIFRKYSLLCDHYDVSFQRRHVLSMSQGLKTDVIEGYEYALDLSKRDEEEHSHSIDDGEELETELESFIDEMKKHKRTVH